MRSQVPKPLLCLTVTTIEDSDRKSVEYKEGSLHESLKCRSHLQYKRISGYEFFLT